MQCGENGVFRSENSDAGGISGEDSARRLVHVFDPAGEGEAAAAGEEGGTAGVREGKRKA